MAQGVNGIEGYTAPLGNYQIDASGAGPFTVLNAVDASAATLAAIPNATMQLIFQADGASIRWTDDGQTPSATFGNLLATGEIVKYTGKISQLKFIKVSGTPKINLSFYGQGA